MLTTLNTKLCTLLLVAALCLPTCVLGQAAMLQSGPMVGAATTQTVKLWVQTKQSATVQFAYYPAGQTVPKQLSAKVRTLPENAFATHIELSGLLPGHRYGYELYLNNELVQLAYPLGFSTAPHPDSITDFSFAAGSCAYLPPDSADHSLRIFPAIYRQQPDLMLWLGDNMYIGKENWTTLQGYHQQYTANRSIAGLQPLLGAVHHLAIWDDHDYGSNNAYRNWPFKKHSLSAFRTFWPNPGFPASGGTYSSFRWADAEFFLLDCRWFRSSSRALPLTREMLGPEQLSWLLENLEKSTATFKFICIGSQVLSTASVSENYTRYGRELKKLLDGISKARIKGVIFLDGDRHITELSRLSRGSDYPLQGLTVSPLTASPGKGGPNGNRVPGTLVTQPNFAHLRISGAKGDRSLHINIHNTAGELLWQKTVHEREIR